MLYRTVILKKEIAEVTTRHVQWRHFFSTAQLSQMLKKRKNSLGIGDSYLEDSGLGRDDRSDYHPPPLKGLKINCPL